MSNQKKSNLIQKNIKASFKTKVKNTLKLILSIDIDWLFIALFTFLFLNLNIWLRLLGAIGASYVYKMVSKTISQIIMLRK